MIIFLFRLIKYVRDWKNIQAAIFFNGNSSSLDRNHFDVVNDVKMYRGLEMQWLTLFDLWAHQDKSKRFISLNEVRGLNVIKIYLLDL